MRLPLLIPILALLALPAIAGCGSSSSSGSEPAEVAPPTSPLFVEATLRPEGALKSNVESLSGEIAGIPNPGAKIVSKLESALAESDTEVNYAKDIEPWLGEKGGIFFKHYDGNNFSGVGFAIQSTDTEATQALIEKLGKSSKSPVKEASYEGVDFKVQESDGSAVGLVDDMLVFGEDEETFKAAVEASKGTSLADESSYTETVSSRPSGSLADVYADIGALIAQAETPATDQTLQTLKAIGLDPSDATALASVVPGSDQIEIDLSSDLGHGGAPSAGAPDLLGSFPASSLAAVASSGVGAELKQAIDSADEAGIPPNVPPHQLKSTLAAAGIDLDKIAGSIEEAGAFVEGTSASDLDGAAVLKVSDSKTAAETVGNVGLLLRRANTAGVTAVSGQGVGFSIRSAEFGKKPIVVVAKGDRIAVGYGLPAALAGLETGSSAEVPTLAEDASFKAAGSSLGGTPLTGFADGGGVLELAEAMGAGSEPEFAEIKPYLEKAQYLALGSEADGERTATKVIVGFGK